MSDSTAKVSKDSTPTPLSEGAAEENIIPLQLRKSASWSLAQLDTAIRASVNAAIARAKIESLTLRGFWLLEAIDTDTGIAQTELGEILGMDRSDMVRLIDSLEKAGLVTRTRDVNDRRRQLITLSDDGKSARTSLRRAIRRAERSAVAAMSQSEPYAIETVATLLTLADSTDDASDADDMTDTGDTVDVSDTASGTDAASSAKSEPEDKSEDKSEAKPEKSKKKSKKKKKKKKKKADKKDAEQ